ncbi:MAG: ATP-binding cassette domain-containing protein [Chloroflexota bacterium]|nr:ATP-binding cassette domain-containing protein [Chloroflexota bacterium]
MTISPAPANAIVAERLHRVYAKKGRWLRSHGEVVAVEEISFAVPTGTIFGLLGPNGAGKTTTIKMLSTLLLPTSGTATIGGHDIVRDERQVRRQLGVVLGGDRGLYDKLSAWDNLVYFGTLYGMDATSIQRRANEVLELVKLQDRAAERVEGFSRGMKQRLHLAKSLIHNPPILILDEPTIGLDPNAAVDLREAIAALVPEHTVLLTTHYMHEADQLCREIAIVDHGRIVARGSPKEVKGLVAGDRRIEITINQALDGTAATIEREIAALPGIRGTSRELLETGETRFSLLCAEPTLTLDGALAALRCHGVAVSAVEVAEPSLEDAFLAITGRSFE